MGDETREFGVRRFDAAFTFNFRNSAWLLPRFLLLIAPLVLATSCALHVVPTKTLEHGYESFNEVDEPNLKLRLLEEQDKTFLTLQEEILEAKDTDYPIPTPWHFGLDEITSQPVVFIIAPPVWDARPLPEDPEGKKQEEILFTIRERLYRYMLRQYPHPVRVRYAWSSSDSKLSEYRVITLTSRVTDFETGIGITRYLLGWGIGQTEIQIEGAILKGPERDLKIGEYAVRAGHGGYAQNGWNPNVLRFEYCLRYAVEEAVNQLTELLPESIPGIQTREDLQRKMMAENW